MLVSDCGLQCFVFVACAILIDGQCIMTVNHWTRLRYLALLSACFTTHSSADSNSTYVYLICSALVYRHLVKLFFLVEHIGAALWPGTT